LFHHQISHHLQNIFIIVENDSLTIPYFRKTCLFWLENQQVCDDGIDDDDDDGIDDD
jgi:hypothetical protein